MAATLKKNAYHILGLDTSASERECLKRSKEIVNRLKADDNPDYDLDLDLVEKWRSEDAVKDAMQRLHSPKKRIREYFFWFQISDDVDEQVFDLLKRNDLPSAISTWENAAEGQSTKAYFYKRNLALLYCLELSSRDNKEFLHRSLALWKELIDSDKFWASFSKVYKLHDEQTASEEIIDDFKSHVIEYLSDLYTEMHHVHRSDDYVNEFQKLFSVTGERLEKSVLAPAYQSINEAVEELEAMKVSADGTFDQMEAEAIKRLVSKIQLELNKLIDLGLFDESPTKIMRDRSANALRSIVLDLHNNLSELDKSRGLLQVAIQLAGTESLKNKLNDELQQIEENLQADTVNSVAIEVPGMFGSGTVLFKNNYIEYDNTRIFFKDATSISYHAQSQSVNLIPVSQTFSYFLGSGARSISIALSSSLHIGKKAKQEAWGKIVHMSTVLIEPYIVKGVVDRIFDRGETVRIGNVEFSKEGYSRNKFKLFGGNEKEMVAWSEKIWVPQFQAGNVVLYKSKDPSGREFASVAMSIPNAVIIPSLIKACVNRA